MKILFGSFVIITFWLCIGLLLFSFTNQMSKEHYVISRSDGYPSTVKMISKEYNLYSDIQFIPINAYIKVGMDYFCTVEFVDSTYLVNYTNHYFGNFNYGGLRFHTWQLIELSKDSTYNLTSDIKEWSADDYKFVNDTIYSVGLKIYNIEKYTLDKYMKRLDSIYVEPYL